MNCESEDAQTRITDKIIAVPEQGIPTWMKPWNARNTAGRIIRPVRHNGVAYSGITIPMLGSRLWTRASPLPSG